MHKQVRLRHHLIGVDIVHTNQAQCGEINVRGDALEARYGRTRLFQGNAIQTNYAEKRRLCIGFCEQKGPHFGHREGVLLLTSKVPHYAI